MTEAPPPKPPTNDERTAVVAWLRAEAEVHAESAKGWRGRDLQRRLIEEELQARCLRLALQIESGSHLRPRRERRQWVPVSLFQPRNG